MPTMDRLSLPPGRPDQPYILGAYEGETIYVPTSAAIVRNLAMSEETRGDFLFVGGGGVASSHPVPFHYHKKTQHDFLCVRGQMKVWLNDQCRILSAGDYATATPNTIHSYQFLSDHTEIFGIVVPGGWENFFRAIGDIYDGPMWQDADDSDPRTLLVPRVMKAAEEFDVIPVHSHKAVEVQPWTDVDNQLPGAVEPFFLRNGQGPSAVLGGTVIRPIATGAETANKYTAGSIEGSSQYKSQVLAGGFRFQNALHGFFVAEGYILLSIDSEKPSRLGPTEFALVPAGQRFEITIESRYAKFYVYSHPGGLVDLLFQAGKSNPMKAPNCMIPSSPAPYERKELQKWADTMKFEMW